LPDAEGFAGGFAGVSNDVLLSAGGTNFPGKKPWEGGVKVWYDQVFALKQPTGSWERVGVLPEANGYGVSVTTPGGLICVGGGNASVNFRAVFRLSYRDEKLITESLPALPKPCAFMAGTMLGSTLYIAGGIETPAATSALSVFWSLDLQQLERGWQSLATWPGAERMLACMGSAEGSVFLFSGARLKAGADGKAEREWLRDAYRYTPGQGWKKVADLPRVSVAAPSPAPVRGGKLLMLGGDDGALVNFEPKDKHPGFPRSILAYDPQDDSWRVDGEVPFSLVTTPAVMWRDRIVIPGGEARPGKRSPDVWMER
jgi:N-acetylneuraminic acid mutarotase